MCFWFCCLFLRYFVVCVLSGSFMICGFSFLICGFWFVEMMKLQRIREIIVRGLHVCKLCVEARTFLESFYHGVYSDEEIRKEEVLNVEGFCLCF